MVTRDTIVNLILRALTATAPETAAYFERNYALFDVQMQAVADAVNRKVQEAVVALQAMSDAEERIIGAGEADRRPAMADRDAVERTSRRWRSFPEVIRRLAVAQYTDEDPGEIMGAAPAPAPAPIAPSIDPLRPSPSFRGFVVITGQQGIEVSRPADAVRVVEQVRDETGLRASTMPRGFGNVVKYPEGQVVGHVSYNGRFWTPRTPLPLHQPTIMPPADVWEEESPPPPAFRAGRPVAVGRDDVEHAYIKALEKAAKATKNPLLRDLYTREIHRVRAEHTPPTVGAPVAVWRRVIAKLRRERR